MDLAKVTSTGTYDRITPTGIEAAVRIQPKSKPAPGGVHGYYGLVEDKYDIQCGLGGLKIVEFLHRKISSKLYNKTSITVSNIE